MIFLRALLNRNFITAMIIGALTLVLLAWNPAVLRHLENSVLNVYFQHRGPISPKDVPIVIVSIDDQSIREEGPWPWTRRRLAELIDSLNTRYQVKTIATDMMFSERERSIVDDLHAWMNQQDHKPDQRLIEQFAHVSNGDERLAKAIHDSGNVVEGYYYYTAQSPELFDARDPHADFSRIAESAMSQVSQAEENHCIIEAEGLRSNIPQLAAASTAAGFLNFAPDQDGILRFTPLLIHYESTYMPSLALAAVQHFNDSAPLSATVLSHCVEINLGKHHYRADQSGMAWINYYGDKSTVPILHATDVLSGKTPNELLKGKLVFLGVTTSGMHDLHATPYDAMMPGVEVHAQLALNLLHDDLISRPDVVYWVEWMIILVIALGYGLWFPAAIRRSYGLTTLFFMVFWFYVGYGLFLQGIWLQIILPLMQLMLTFAVLLALNFAEALYKRQQLRYTFSQFIDPSIVDEAIDHPEQIGLTGDKREISVMFLDVAGFTKLSEALDPHDVVHYINMFFHAATPIVFEHHGCIDRLTGDGLVELFGAPLPDPQHALHACRAALALEQALDSVREHFDERGYQLHVRIGINTGEMVVGNVGSHQRLHYTFMGDSGNAAARLESLNKQYGTNRMIGQRTFELVQDDFVCRELDCVVLVGKSEPMHVYELLGEKDQAPQFEPLLTAYAAALCLYREGDFLKASEYFSLCADQFDDEASQIMFDRCLGLHKHPPKHWQGIWMAKSK